jgi:hypothetical protein
VLRLACAVGMLYNVGRTSWTHTQGRATMTTYVYAGAADWGGKDPAKCNRGLYRLATDTGTWTALEGSVAKLLFRAFGSL